jgi:hypothetical protein
VGRTLWKGGVLPSAPHDGLCGLYASGARRNRNLFRAELELRDAHAEGAVSGCRGLAHQLINQGTRRKHSVREHTDEFSSWDAKC